ncbi:hypothetical protein RTBOTA2_001036 [Rhodotorula toruloides]|nr:hypothetical protein RTBOTA2_001036 [Rhodotorula toruloides]
MSEPYDDIQDMLGSHEQHFLEDQYGGYENLMASYGLKPWDDDYMDVGFDLVHHFAQEKDDPRGDPQGEPPLTDKERKILKSGWGDWTNFCTSYGLKPWDQDDAAEAKAILEAMARQDEE